MKIAYNPPGHPLRLDELQLLLNDLLLDASAKKVFAHGHWLDKARQVESVVIDPDNADTTGYAPANKENLDNYTIPGTFWTLVYKANYYTRTQLTQTVTGLPIAESGELFVGALSGPQGDTPTYVYQRFTSATGHVYVRYKGANGWKGWGNVDDDVKLIEVTTNNDRPLMLGALSGEMNDDGLGNLYKIASKLFANPATGILSATGLSANVLNITSNATISGTTLLNLANISLLNVTGIANFTNAINGNLNGIATESYKWVNPISLQIKDADSTNAGTAITIDGSANKIITLPSTIKASLSGNASTATTLQTARKLWGNSFNGSADINGTLDPGASSASTVGTITHPFASAVVGSFVKIGGCTEQWDATNKCLKFIFD